MLIERILATGAHVRSWLETTIHPSADEAAIVLGVFLAMWAVRSWLPQTWERIADYGPADKTLRKLWQSIPSLVSGALAGGFLGGDFVQSAYGAVMATLAPMLHHVLKASPLPYQGGKPPASKRGGGPPVGPSVLLLCALALPCVSGCAAWQKAKPYARTVNDAARILCETTFAESAESERAGLSPREWCAIHGNLKPFLEAVLSAQQVAAGKAGLSR